LSSNKSKKNTKAAMENYLVECYDLSSFVFTKPKKQGDYMISRIKNNNDPIFVQFPRMLVVSEENSKSVELEFLNENGYN
jgi:hypothetical protein